MHCENQKAKELFRYFVKIKGFFVNGYTFLFRFMRKRSNYRNSNPFF